MKSFLTVFILFIAFTFIWPNISPGEDSGKFVPFIVSNLPPKPLDSAKASLVKDGMTLKMLVAALGPGWMSPNENVGFFSWSFTDGRRLDVLPEGSGRLESESEIITYKGGRGFGYMRWEPNPFR